MQVHLVSYWTILLCTKQFINPHTLLETLFDVIVFPQYSGLEVSNITSDFFTSDHAFLIGNLSISQPTSLHKKVLMRKLCSIDHDNFKCDIISAVKEMSNTEDLDDLVDQYNSKLSSILDKQAPQVCKSITIRDELPWFDIKAKELKAKMCSPERKNLVSD